MSAVDDWRFCPRCRSELRRAERRVECPTCGFSAYANPAPTACALCVNELGEILLARRAHEPFQGYWDLPGGFVEEGEHPLDCIRRELREETGLEVEPLAFVGVWIDTYGEGGSGSSTLNLYWTARALAGDPRPADDVVELRWVAPHDLPPPDELAFHIAEVLATWRQQHT